MLRATVAISLVLLLASCATSRSVDTGFLNRTLTLGGRDWRYVVYVPRDWTPDRQWPVILFLHGAGERGNDGLRQTAVGLGPLLRWSPEKVPAVVVFPQAPHDERWLAEPADVAMAALERSIAEFHGDRARVYLTGLSMGGYGTWHLATAHPHVFAALVPVCGGLVPAGSATSVRQSPLTIGQTDPYAFTAQRIKHISTWIFHGADDTVVLPSESRSMHDALRAAGADVRYSEYEGVGHNSWDRAYGEEELWKWIVTQRR